MKKFLSLVLALVMTMSLVTISAGATEYKDLTDKDEIQYEEAVAVLNRIGIITGYDDGTFRPETELTRGAAAKIIVSLMIGPEAANALPNTYSPYPDVPAGHTFAGVISYCKTAGYISGYGDGTFKPANSLTGFAFAKMLLGALGYKSDLEGFTGTGWTMNVAKLGNAAGLFNRLSFQGAEAVNREEACQLALNTLKATMVEYTGGFNIVSGDATIVGNQVRTYITSNQDYAAHINNKKVTDAGNANVNNHYTVEFGEEHFKDLRMRRERTTLDDFGRPSNEWSYKKVTIGTFPVEPDFVYTTQVTAVNDVKVTKATKIRDLELNGYEVDGGTLLKVNGKTESVFTDDNNIEKIADYTDNGTVVEVYVSEDHADYVENVVVVKTQLMEVKKLGSDYVALDKEDDCDDNEKTGGFNQPAIEEKVDDVEVNDVCYDFLKGLKAGDKVAVIPVTVDEGDSYTVARAYTPETVTGSLDGSRSFANTSVTDPKRSVIEVTVGGTAYKVATWNKDLQDANRDVIKVTNKDVTLLLDEFGNALLAKDIGSTAEYMILGAWRNSVVNGVLVRLATGWDVKGTEISLNVGSEQSNAVAGYKAYKPGDVLRYTNDGVTGTAEWKLSKAGVYLTPGNVKVTDLDSFAIKASNSAVTLKDYKGVDKDETLEVASGIKTIYVTFDVDGEVDYIEIKDGLQNISQRELDYKGLDKPRFDQAEATISKLSGNAPTDKSEVTFVVVKDESNDATLKNLGFVYKNDNTTNNRDENGDILTKYNVFTVDDENVSMTANKSITNYHYVRFKLLDEAAGRYDLKDYDVRQRTTSVAKVTAQEVVSPNSNNLIRLKDEYRNMAGDKLPLTNDPMPNINTNKQGWGTDAAGTDLTEGDKYKDLINVKGAKFLDLVNSSSVKIDDADDLKDALKEYDVEMSIAFNDNPDNDEFRKAYIVVITKLNEKDTTDKPTDQTGSVRFDTDMAKRASIVGTPSIKTLSGSGKTTATFSVKAPEWIVTKMTQGAGSEDLVINKYSVYLDGKLYDEVNLGAGALKATAYSASTPTSSTALMANNATKNSEVNTYTITDYNLSGALATSTGFSVNTVNEALRSAKTIELVITDMNWYEVKVQYVTDGGTEPYMTSTTDKIKVDGTDDIDFELDDDKYAATTQASFTITHAKAATAADQSGKTNPGTPFNSTGNFTPDQEGYVTVTLTGMTSATTVKYYIGGGSLDDVTNDDYVVTNTVGQYLPITAIDPHTSEANYWTTPAAIGLTAGIKVTKVAGGTAVTDAGTNTLMSVASGTAVTFEFDADGTINAAFKGLKVSADIVDARGKVVATVKDAIIDAGNSAEFVEPGNDKRTAIVTVDASTGDLSVKNVKVDKVLALAKTAYIQGKSDGTGVMGITFNKSLNPAMVNETILTLGTGIVLDKSDGDAVYLSDDGKSIMVKIAGLSGSDTTDTITVKAQLEDVDGYTLAADIDADCDGGTWADV